MTFWIVFQVVVNMGLIALGLVVWARVSRPQKDDPRLSRGLQLLQSKIAVLEDLSDRTDIQVKQLSHLLDQKAKDMDQKISNAEEQLLKVDHSIQRSLEVSKIFQDKIPHKEIIERQNTLKYIQAARLAHQGLAAHEIANKVDIPMGELEFIVKVNKNKLMFSEEHLPEWVQENLNVFENQQPENSAPVIKPTLARSLNLSFENRNQSVMNTSDIERIEMEFRRAVESESAQNNSMQTPVRIPTQQPPPPQPMTEKAPISMEPNMEIKLPESGEIEISLEGDFITSDLKSSIQKARELISKTMDKTFDAPGIVAPKVLVPEVLEAKSRASPKASPKVIKSEILSSNKVKPYQFRKIDL